MRDVFFVSACVPCVVFGFIGAGGGVVVAWGAHAGVTILFFFFQNRCAICFGADKS